MFDCISTVSLVLTSRNLVFIFFHSKLNRFECQLFLYLRISYIYISYFFTLNSYLLQIEYFLFYAYSHCIIQNITLSSESSFFRKQFFQNGCLLLKSDTLFQNGCLFLKMAALGFFSKLLCFKFTKGFQLICLFAGGPTRINFCWITQ